MEAQQIDLASQARPLALSTAMVQFDDVPHHHFHLHWDAVFEHHHHRQSRVPTHYQGSEASHMHLQTEPSGGQDIGPGAGVPGLSGQWPDYGSPSHGPPAHPSRPGRGAVRLPGLRPAEPPDARRGGLLHRPRSAASSAFLAFCVGAGRMMHEPVLISSDACPTARNQAHTASSQQPECAHIARNVIEVLHGGDMSIFKAVARFVCAVASDGLVCFVFQYVRKPQLAWSHWPWFRWTRSHIVTGSRDEFQWGHRRMNNTAHMLASLSKFQVATPETMG